MAYTEWEVVAFEQPTAAKWNQLGENDAGFRDGTNILDDAIIQRHIADQAVGAAQRKEVVKVGNFALPGANGNIVITGVGFRPKFIMLFPSLDANHQSASVLNFSIGFGDGTTSRSQGFRGQESSDISGSVSTSLVGFLPGTNASQSNTLTLSSFDADGFTLAFVGSTTTNVAYIVIG